MGNCNDFAIAEYFKVIVQLYIAIKMLSASFVNSLIEWLYKKNKLYKTYLNEKGFIKMIYKNVLEAIGHTPIIQLQRMVPQNYARVFSKI